MTLRNCSNLFSQLSHIEEDIKIAELIIRETYSNDDEDVRELLKKILEQKFLEYTKKKYKNI